MPDTPDDRFNQIVAENIRLEREVIERRSRIVALEEDVVLVRRMAALGDEKAKAFLVEMETRAKGIRNE